MCVGLINNSVLPHRGDFGAAAHKNFQQDHKQLWSGLKCIGDQKSSKELECFAEIKENQFWGIPSRKQPLLFCAVYERCYDEIYVIFHLKFSFRGGNNFVNRSI